MRIKIRKLYRNLVLLIIIIISILMLSVSFIIRESRDNLARERIKGLSEQAVKQYSEFNTPISKVMSAIQDWGVSGIIDLNQPEKLSAQLIPLLKNIKEISGLSIADENGGSFFLKPEKKQWSYQYSIKNKSMSILLDSVGQKIKEWSDTLAYDPRERIWFSVNQQNPDDNDISWTEPYSFFSTQAWGISGAMSWLNKDGNRVVAAIDIPLKKLFENISQVADNEENNTFLFNSHKRVFDPESPPDFFISTDKIPNMYYNKLLEDWSDTLLFQTQSFTFKNNKYWAGLQPINAASKNIWLATVSKEKSFFDVLGYRILYIGLVTFVLIGIGFVGSWWIIKNSKADDKDDVHLELNDFEHSLLKLIARGEGPRLEFKSTVRMNLHSGQAGKEIELAWLKGIAAFLNTKGGILLIGVNDSGEIVGIEQDGFANEDKCLLHIKNLIRQHIGTDFSPYIEYDLKTINDKQVIYFKVKPADIPAYLIGKNKEELFYIRSGPASEKLSISKVVDYLKRRKV